MDININFNSKSIKRIFKQLQILGEKMATLDERLAAILAVVNATQGKVDSAQILGQKIFEEVRALANAQGVTLEGLDELEAKTALLSESIVKSVENLGELDALIPDA
jgi:hypothetical protein